MSTQQNLRICILLVILFLTRDIAHAQGTENAIAAGFISALLTGGLILFIIVLPIVLKLSRRKKEASVEDRETDSTQMETTEPASALNPLGTILKGCLTLIVCLIVGAIIVFLSLK